MNKIQITKDMLFSLVSKARLSTVANFISRGLICEDWINATREELKKACNADLIALFESAVILGSNSFLPGSGLEAQLMELCNDFEAKIDLGTRAYRLYSAVIIAKNKRDEEIEAELGL